MPLRPEHKWGSLEGYACDKCHETRQIVVHVAYAVWSGKEWWCLACIKAAMEDDYE